MHSLSEGGGLVRRAGRGSEKFLASIDRDLNAVRTIERIRP
jgi:hypothetical protein